MLLGFRKATPVSIILVPAREHSLFLEVSARKHMQVRGSEFNQQRSQLGQVSRKQTGSLAVRDLSQIVSEKDVVNTENLITLFVVVPKHQKKEWLSSYESIAEYIVSAPFSFCDHQHAGESHCVC